MTAYRKARAKQKAQRVGDLAYKDAFERYSPSLFPHSK
jgi:hypothetical protein